MGTKTQGSRAEGTAGDLPARERLLAAAEELFYEEGVHSVGINRVLARAGVAKDTLYSAFGSKEATASMESSSRPHGEGRHPSNRPHGTEQRSPGARPEVNR